MNTPAVRATLTDADIAVFETYVAALNLPYRVECDPIGKHGIAAMALPEALEDYTRLPKFVIARLDHHVFFSVFWPDGSVFQTHAFRAVEDPAGLMASGIFAALCAEAGQDVPYAGTNPVH